MALPALIQAAIARIRAANNNAYDAASNPAGLGQGGHRQNLVPDMNAVADIGVFAGECADKADADVALTHADVALTHQDASNTALDRIATAQSVLDAAGKVALAAAEADRAKAQADLAKAIATGLKLPAVTPDMAGRFLKVNADGTAYELGLITIATAAEINAGTGTGFANAQTLGPILQGMKDGTTAAAGMAPPVGSYLFWPTYTKGDPGANWLEAKGQIVSLSAYPALADVLPVYVKQLGLGNPANQPTVFRTETTLRGCLFVGNRFVTISNDYVKNYNTADGTSIEAATTTRLCEYRLSQNIRPIARDGGTEVLYRHNNNSQIMHLDISSASAIAAGDFAFSFAEMNTSDNGNEGLYKLSNGAVIFCAYANNASYGAYCRFWVLRAGAARNGWLSFDPIATVNMPTSTIAHFQTKNGTVYAILRPRGSSDQVHTIYKTTDGVGWTTVGTFTLVGGQITTGFSRDRSSKVKDVGHKEESPDGQQIIFNLTYGFLISTNGGQSFTYYQDWNAFLSISANGYTTFDPTNASQSFRISFTYDKFAGKWVFVGVLNKPGSTPNGQVFLAIWTADSLAGPVTRIIDLPVGTTTGTSHPDTRVMVVAARNHYFILHSSSSFRSILRVARNSPSGPVTMTNVIGNALYVLEGHAFDGAIVITTSAAEVVWLSNDPTGEIVDATNGPATNYSLTEHGVSENGKFVCNVTYNSSSGFYTAWMGTFYDYNPDTERRLPNTSVQYPSGLPAISEQYRAVPTTPPRTFMRVK